MRDAYQLDGWGVGEIDGVQLDGAADKTGQVR